ncbi:MAG: peptidylprolyl isomerase [Lachnospiraceae bacterium]|nr:peptidylprolyl isomerase [Lachnospiraceae bacterium]
MKKLMTLAATFILGAVMLTGCGNPGYTRAEDMEKKISEMTETSKEQELRAEEEAEEELTEDVVEEKEIRKADAPSKEELGITGDVFADIVIKDEGTITVQLDYDMAPATVANFIKLAESGFYDGLTFHRIMNGFMMQGGDPLGNGTGGSDENIVGEFEANGYTNTISHTRGVISMARANDPNSGSSQFFIVHQDSTFLDGNYAAFGCVTEGMDIVDKICTEAQPIDDNGTIPAEAQPVIEKVVIRK